MLEPESEDHHLYRYTDCHRTKGCLNLTIARKWPAFGCFGCPELPENITVLPPPEEPE